MEMEQPAHSFSHEHVERLGVVTLASSVGSPQAERAEARSRSLQVQRLHQNHSRQTQTQQPM